MGFFSDLWHGKEHVELVDLKPAKALIAMMDKSTYVISRAGHIWYSPFGPCTYEGIAVLKSYLSTKEQTMFETDDGKMIAACNIREISFLVESKMEELRWRE